MRRGGEADQSSQVPDQGEEVVVVLTGRPAEFDLVGARADVGVGQVQADIGLLCGLVTWLQPAPTSTLDEPTRQAR